MGFQCRSARTHVSTVMVQVLEKNYRAVSSSKMRRDHDIVALTVKISSSDVSNGQQRISIDKGVLKFVISLPDSEKATGGR
jgi:hypothetical protein